MTNPPRKKIVSIDPRDPAFLNPFDGLRNVTVSKKEMVALQSDLAAAQKRIAELEQSREELRKACAQVLGYNEEAWPSHGNSPLAVCAALALRVQRIKELEAALRLFKGAAVPCCTTIDPRGYQWCEAYLDQALTGEPR